MSYCLDDGQIDAILNSFGHGRVTESARRQFEKDYSDIPDVETFEDYLHFFEQLPRLAAETRSSGATSAQMLFNAIAFKLMQYEWANDFPVLLADWPAVPQEQGRFDA